MNNDNKNILHNSANKWKPSSKGKQTIPFYSHHVNVFFLIQYIGNRGGLKGLLAKDLLLVDFLFLQQSGPDYILRSIIDKS